MRAGTLAGRSMLGAVRDCGEALEMGATERWLTEEESEWYFKRNGR